MAGPKVTLTFDADSSRLEASIERVGNSSSRLERRFRDLRSGVGIAWAALGSGAAVIGGAMAGLGSLGLMAGTAALAMNGSKDAVEAYNKALEEGTGDMSEYNKLLAQMTPQQQAFTQALISTQGPIKQLQQTAAAGFLPGATDAINGAVTLLPVLDSAISKTALIMGDAGTKLGNLFKTEQFQSDLDTFLNSTTGVTEAVSSAIVSLTGKLVDFGAKMAPAAEGFANFITDVTTGFEGFLENLTPYADDFKSIWDSLGKILLILLPIIGSVAGSFASQLAPVLQWVATVLSENRGTIEWFLTNLPSFIAAWMAMRTVTGILQSVRLAILGIQLLLMMNPWVAAIAAVVAIATLIILNWDKIKAAVAAAWNWIKSTAISVWNSILGFFKGIWNSITSAFNSGVNNAKNVFNNLVGFVQSIPGRIMGAIGNLGSLLINSGRSLIMGLWDGIQGAFGWVKSKVSGLMSSLRNLFPFSPAKEGPFSGHGYTSYSGLALATDFGKGIENGMPSVLGSINDLMGAAQMGFQGNVNMMGGTPVNTGPSNLVLDFGGNTDSAFASAFMGLVRRGQIQVVTA